MNQSIETSAQTPTLSLLERWRLRQTRNRVRSLYKEPEDLGKKQQRQHLRSLLRSGSIRPDSLTGEQLELLYPAKDFWRKSLYQLLGWLGLGAALLLYLWLWTDALKDR